MSSHSRSIHANATLGRQRSPCQNSKLIVCKKLVEPAFWHCRTGKKRHPCGWERRLPGVGHQARLAAGRAVFVKRRRSAQCTVHQVTHAQSLHANSAQPEIGDLAECAPGMTQIASFRQVAAKWLDGNVSFSQGPGNDF